MADVAAEVEALRVATREAHEVLKDLRAERRALAVEKAEVGERVRATVEAAIEARVAAGLAEYAATVEAAMTAAVAKVNAEFGRLERIFTGREDPSKPPLEDLIRARVARRGTGVAGG